MSVQFDTKNDVGFLRSWQKSRMMHYDENGFVQPSIGPADVTVLTYFFHRTEDCHHAASEFLYLKCAILETWCHCGMLKTVIVSNENFPFINEFANEFEQWVSIEIEHTLVPGDVNSLSIDCNSKLWTRFETPYVLTVQDDGFPLRSGLENFIGKYDFVGAPWRRTILLSQIAGTISRVWPSNGGFSLRSKRICTMASKLWHRYWQDRPFVWEEQSEDIFYTKTLPKKSLWYRLSIRFAPSRVAINFSYDAPGFEVRNLNPLGFHGAKAFRILMGG